MTEEEKQLLIKHARAIAQILYKDAPIEKLTSLGKIEEISVFVHQLVSSVNGKATKSYCSPLCLPEWINLCSLNKKWDAPRIASDRAGRYVQQMEGYKAFIPNPLPPIPEIIMDQEMWGLLSQADRALGRLDGSTDALPNPDLFVFMYVRKEAVLSSQIEGTQASLIDVLEFESQALESDNPQEVAEVVNYVSAIN